MKDTKPFMLIGSPPCTLFSTLQNLSKNVRNEAEFQKQLEIAKKHVRFCVELYTMQIEGEGISSMNIPKELLHGPCQKF